MNKMTILNELLRAPLEVKRVKHYLSSLTVVTHHIMALLNDIGSIAFKTMHLIYKRQRGSSFLTFNIHSRPENSTCKVPLNQGPNPSGFRHQSFLHEHLTTLCIATPNGSFSMRPRSFKHHLVPNPHKVVLPMPLYTMHADYYLSMQWTKTWHAHSIFRAEESLGALSMTAA